MSHKWVLHGFECRVSLPRQLFLALLILVLPIPAFAKMYEEPKSFGLKDASQEKVDLKVLPKIDPERLLAEDKDRGKNSRQPVPLRFAVAAEVAFNLDNSGTWQDVPDGRVWRLRIQGPGSINLNLGITRFEMPEGAKLWIYDPAHKHVEGPYTAKHRSHLGSLWTPIIEGNEMVVEVFVPKGASKPVVEITKANRGYRGFRKAGIFGQSEGACEIDVICPEGDAWRDQIRAVNLYTINGTGACTGNLMNNTALDFRPFVLSANHCGVNTTTDATIVVFWNFDSPTCGTHDPGPLTDTQSGATFRASNATSDFVLFELDAAPDPGFNVFWAGWDRSNTAPPGVEGIHHPSADVKAITPSHNVPTRTAYFSDVTDPNGTHWRVVWDGPAVTEPGSSGSCIFASDTGRCIGQLHGGPSACGVSAADRHDFYGRFDLSWTGGGTNSTRLSNWLDPGNTGVLGLDGDPHITTADGVHYDFQSAGEFVSLRQGEDMEIQTRQAPIATTFNPGPDDYDGLATCVSLNTAVAARVGKRRVTYEPNLSGVPDPSGLQLRVDGTLTTLGPGGLDLGNGGRIASTSAPGGIAIDFPNGSVLNVTPGWWTSQSKWYLNVDVVRSGGAFGMSGGAPGKAGNGGIAGPIAPRSWLPALPDGSSMGPMPPALHDRYVDLYQKFADAWRVTEKISLFDYAPGTSTDTFTMKSWPPEHPPCVIPQTEPVQPATQLVAERACRGVTDKFAHRNCVFDVRVTGNTGFGKTYLHSQRVAAGSTRTTVRDDKDPTKPDEPVTFVAVVTRRLGAGVPAGTVQFMLDGERAGKPIPLVRGQARWKTAQLKAGEHKVSAHYQPKAGTTFQASASATEIHTVK
ncbi:MAG TPA: Ig-like domain-containing protein [Thermoanaerobaculia bacterium]|nr:Ig-like domain-containing protein [Thermoanaerobaculia bacterium]